MRKKVGDIVEKNEIIAGYTAFFGLIKKFAKSPVTGTIEMISDLSGQVLIREPAEPIRINAYIGGTVTKVVENRGAVIDTPGSLIQGIIGIGGETYGELMVMETPDQFLIADMIVPECTGKILVTKFSPKLDALHKLVKLGAKGVISGGVDPKVLVDFIGHTMGVVITGHEEIGLTLIVTEGFGEKMKMSEKNFQLLKKHAGRICCMNGATQIRAGVIRPEVIIPQEEIDLSGVAETDIEDTKVLSAGLMPGTRVRIIREPYFGELGHVFELPPKLQIIETESKVRVLGVELDDGRRVMVPRANVEIISE
jgi:hypothetical protein